MAKTTIHSIAEATGYSISTVSRVLSGQQTRFSQEAISTIKEAAKRLNYTPNLMARSLRTQKTGFIGVTVPCIDNPFFATLASVIISNLKDLGYSTILADSMEDEQDFRNAISMFLSRNVDGIVAVPVGSTSGLLEEVAESIPVILVDRYFDGTTLPYICTDNYAGGLMATEYLISRGCRSILSIQGVEDSTPSKERLRGFEDAIRKSKKKISCAVCGNAFSVENGYSETIKHFSEGLKFDAVFAYSSTILLGAMKAFQELGIKVPEQVGIISFDNNGFLDYLNPAVTRIEQPLTEIGAIATKTLGDILEQKYQGIFPQTLITPSLVIRESC